LNGAVKVVKSLINSIGLPISLTRQRWVKVEVKFTLEQVKGPEGKQM
jgi:hypothetical protein